MADISAEIAAFKGAVYGEDVRNSLVTLANKLNNEVENNSLEMDKTFSYIGSLTSTDDLDTLSEFGVYTFTHSSPPQHIPNGYTGDARLLNIKYYTDELSSIHSQIFIGNNSDLYYRIKNSVSGSFGSWVVINHNTYVSLNSIAQDSDYLLSHVVYDNIAGEVSPTAGWTDLPEQGVGGVLLIHRFNANYQLQVLFGYSNDKYRIWYRITHRTTYNIYRTWTTWPDYDPINMNTVLSIGDKITDSLVTTNNISSFKDFPTNKMIEVEVSDYYALELPYNRPGTYICFDPQTTRGSSNSQSFKIHMYFSNIPTTSECCVWICFGHGSVADLWHNIRDTKHRNPLAEAIFDSNSKIVFAGDSIVAGLGGTNYSHAQSGGGDYIMERGVSRYENISGHCWVNSLKDWFSTVYGKTTNVKNRGVGGITTKQVNDNWDTIVGDATLVILSVGTNDYGDTSNIETYLKAIIGRCKKRRTELMILTNTPTNMDNAEAYLQVKGRIARVCSIYDMPVYDMHSEVMDYLSSHNLEITDILNSDNLHPNDLGYDIMFFCAKKLFNI